MGTSLGANAALRDRRAPPRAAARAGDRDAGARQRPAVERADVHAAARRADVRRAGDEAARAHHPRGAAAAAAALRQRDARPRAPGTGTRAARCCRDCSSGASRRRAASARRSPRRRSCSATTRDPVHPFSDAGMLAKEMPNARLLRGQLAGRAAPAARAADRRDRRVPRRGLGKSRLRAAKRSRQTPPAKRPAAKRAAEPRAALASPFGGNSSSSLTSTCPGAVGRADGRLRRLADPQRDERERLLRVAQRDPQVLLLDHLRRAERDPRGIGDRGGRGVAVGAVDLDGHARRRGDQLEHRHLLLGLQVDQQALRHLRRARRVDLRGPRRRGVAVDREARVAEPARGIVVRVVRGGGVVSSRIALCWDSSLAFRPPRRGARRTWCSSSVPVVGFAGRRRRWCVAFSEALGVTAVSGIFGGLTGPERRASSRLSASVARRSGRAPARCRWRARSALGASACATVVVTTRRLCPLPLLSAAYAAAAAPSTSTATTPRIARPSASRACRGCPGAPAPHCRHQSCPAAIGAPQLRAAPLYGARWPAEPRGTVRRRGGGAVGPSGVRLRRPGRGGRRIGERRGHWLEF